VFSFLFPLFLVINQKQGVVNLNLVSLNCDVFVLFFLGNYDIKVWKFISTFFFSRNHGNQNFFFRFYFIYIYVFSFEFPIVFFLL
jgi:hypothetical protein